MKKVKKPFFAQLLESQRIEAPQNVKGGNGAKGKGPSMTLKYPSDFDEATTMKYPSDNDEDIMTQ
ncbi:MAG: microviridin/marinostatin family tricyclic proteinase inhibitor [Bacteroidota bacterium]